MPTDMAIETKIPALFVSHQNALEPVAGGIQIFTREHLAVMAAAGFDLTVLSYNTDRRWQTRLRRLLRRRPYANLLPPTLADEIVAACRRADCRHVFLNLEETAEVAVELKQRLGDDVLVVLLSAGLNSVDELHSLRGKGTEAVTAGEFAFLGQQFLTEMRHRCSLDLVLCLAPFEVEIERWLGARKVDWLPRTIPVNPLPWHPAGQRLGCVSTLHHYPNMEGLILFLDAFSRIAPPPARFRLVGGPRAKGEALARSYPCMDYVGPLDDAALAVEAATWNCFVHPLFYYARGCSTKLAVALGWHLPVATTHAGARGYAWREGDLLLTNNPDGLAALACRYFDLKVADAAREQVKMAVRSSPTLRDVAEKLRTILDICLV